MWQRFSRNLFLLIFLSISLCSFSKNDTTAYNPFFRDSVLKNKIDSGRWHKLVSVTDFKRVAGKAIFVQKQKQTQKSTVLLFITLVIALLLVVLRLIFDDFSFSLLEGMVSVKKFYIFYKSKKYDSLFAILSVYIFKISILSLVVYIGLRYMQQDDFTYFSFYFFFDIWVLLGLFFTVKNVIEFIFNWVIDTQETFKAFFLQNLFAEFVVSVFLLVLFLIYIYNTHISYDFMFGLLLSGLGVYVVFNIVRSYQLMGNVRIPYKLHFFLYICAFKILPVLLLVKYILNNVVQ